MPVLKKRSATLTQHINGLYIHFSPPRVLNLSSSDIRQLVKLGDINKLEQVVLEGQGKKLIGEYSTEQKVRNFIKTIPSLISKIALLHDAVNSGKLEELKSLLNEEQTEMQKKLVLAKDENGVGLLHKAVYHELKDIYTYLVDNFPHIVNLKDSDGRTAFHYTAMCRDPKSVQKLLIDAGADQSIQDHLQRSTKYYMEHIQELELPNPNRSFHGSFRSPSKDGLTIKKSNIRIWIHQRNLENLQKVVWEGHGSKLLVEHSNNSKVKKFLEAVPHLMGLIKDIHCDVINNDLESLKAHTSPPILPIALSGKDSNGLSPLHKAAGLGHQDIAEYIVSKYPDAIHLKDNMGRTPLHYAALLKDEGRMWDLLIKSGADEAALDERQKSAGYYKSRNSEIDSKLLSYVPEAPRTAKESFVRGWDWNVLTTNTPTEEILKPFKKSETFLGNVAEKIGKVVEEKIKDEIMVNGVKNEEKQMPKHIVSNHLERNGIRNGDNDIQSKKENIKESEKNEAKSNGIKTTNQIKRDAGHTEENESRNMGFGSTNQMKENKKEKIEIVKKELPPFDATVDNGNPKINGTARPTSSSVKHAVNFGEIEERAAIRKNRESLKETEENDNNGNKSRLNQNNPPKSFKQESEDNNNSTETNAAPDFKNTDRKSRSQSRNDSVEQRTNSKSPDSKPINQIHANSKNNETARNRSNSRSPDKKQQTNYNGTGTDNEKNTSKSPQKRTSSQNSEIIDNELINSKNPDTKPKTRGNSLERNNNSKNDVRNESKSPDTKPKTRGNSLERNERNDFESPDKKPKTRENSNNNDLPRAKSNPKSGSGLIKHRGNQEEEEGVIEGIVNGENEVETLNEQGQEGTVDSGPDEQEIVEMIESGNMERLAAVVLSGDGEKLSGHTSDNPELQTFLDNVPTYMSKIRRIHVAAKDGSLRDLQAALDRRKFAIAKDKISPNGASPLHVATVFGNTSIVRYLAGRFPETLQATDDNGRTPLHYAAVLADNGHYYNLLLHLGGDTRTEDKFNHTPDYYKTHRNLMSHAQLLRELGADDQQIDEILCDKDTSAGGQNQVDMPFFRTEEGRYLASSLGDPLIKGLTEVANKRPEDPIAYLATYLANFASSTKPRSAKSRAKTQENQRMVRESPEPVGDPETVPQTIDVVTVEPESGNGERESAFSSTSRDEHGQSMLHFAAARSHGRNALFQLLMETEINLGFRDELYRTARDISIQANLPENTVEIDRYVMHIAINGDIDKLVELLLEGYDHIIDIVDEDDAPIVDAVAKANQSDTVAFLQSILAFEEKRERVHHSIRQNNLEEVKALLADKNESGSGKLLAIGKNSYGRCSLHIAVLCQQEEIVDFIANTFPDTLHVGDNLERTALHYAMGVEKIETLSKVLVKAGAQRVTKDLKGRQPTYYFMNKADILRLQEEEETF